MNAAAVEAIARAHPNLPIQIGGGIRDLPTIERYLKAGVSYVILGTKAVKEPDFVRTACQAFPGKVIVGIDAKDGMVATDGWAEVSSIAATELAKSFEQAGRRIWWLTRGSKLFELSTIIYLYFNRIAVAVLRALRSVFSGKTVKFAGPHV